MAGLLNSFAAYGKGLIGNAVKRYGEGARSLGHDALSLPSDIRALPGRYKAAIADIPRRIEAAASSTAETPAVRRSPSNIQYAQPIENDQSEAAWEYGEQASADVPQSAFANAIRPVRPNPMRRSPAQPLYPQEEPQTPDEGIGGYRPTLGGGLGAFKSSPWKYSR